MLPTIFCDILVCIEVGWIRQWSHKQQEVTQTMLGDMKRPAVGRNIPHFWVFFRLTWDDGSNDPLEGVGLLAVEACWNITKHGRAGLHPELPTMLMFIQWHPHQVLGRSDQNIKTYGVFLTWGPPVIIHFNGISLRKPSSYWGTQDQSLSHGFAQRLHPQPGSQMSRAARVIWPSPAPCCWEAEARNKSCPNGGGIGFTLW